MMNLRAAELWNSCLGPSDKVLILGGSGWFGQTARLMTNLSPDRVMSVASRKRQIEIDTFSYPVNDYDFEAIDAFAPTVVLDLWFLTREKIETRGEAQYVEDVHAIIDRTAQVVALPSVSRVVSVSSGASVAWAKNQESEGRYAAYGAVKVRSENVLTEASQAHGFRLAIARVYSVSGALVTRPQSYAFSDLAIQALSGKMTIRAKTRVLRRFVAVEDVLAVALANLQNGSNSFSSGGEVIEIGDLAAVFAEVLGREISVTREGYPTVGPDDNYYSEDETWESSVEVARFLPLDLRDQAKNVLDFFSALRNPRL
jgi:nucleoside-diphosphate-sugar epimerase